MDDNATANVVDCTQSIIKCLLSEFSLEKATQDSLQKLNQYVKERVSVTYDHSRLQRLLFVQKKLRHTLDLLTSTRSYQSKAIKSAELNFQGIATNYLSHTDPDLLIILSHFSCCFGNFLLESTSPLVEARLESISPSSKEQQDASDIPDTKDSLIAELLNTASGEVIENLMRSGKLIDDYLSNDVLAQLSSGTRSSYAEETYEEIKQVAEHNGLESENSLINYMSNPRAYDTKRTAKMQDVIDKYVRSKPDVESISIAEFVQSNIPEVSTDELGQYNTLFKLLSNQIREQVNYTEQVSIP